jgi:hypothetical protein
VEKKYQTSGNYYHAFRKGWPGGGRMVKKSIVFMVYLYVAVGSFSADAKTFYLDGNLSSNISNGTYSIANRNSSGSDGNAYNNIQDAINNLGSGDTLYIRSGNYTRNGNNNNYGAFGEGSLHITVPSQISSYGNEKPVIYTQPGKMNYNPVPSSMGTDGVRYYPWPAISVQGTGNVTIRGLKTYGQIALQGVAGITVENCDFGGGGPQLDQGIVVYLANTQNVVVRNCFIHRSSASGSAFQMYNTRDLLVENNTFYDNYGTDFNFKDCGSPTSDGSSWGTNTFRYNFLTTSTINNSGGIRGINQDTPVANNLVYQNIFYKKNMAIWFVFPPMTVYNNTFIDCNGGLGTWFDTPVKAYNNIFYNTSTNGSNQYVQLGGVSNGNVSMDYNLYYSTGGIQPSGVWEHLLVFRGLAIRHRERR